jgi:hypothetical protein
MEHNNLAKKAQARVRKKEKAAKKSPATRGGGSTKNGKGSGNVIAIPYRSRISPSGCEWSMVDVVARDRRGVGAELGKQVHHQLELFARDRNLFALEVPRPDPFVSEIIRKILVEWELVPLWSEYEVWDETLKYATSVDMICFHPKKRRFAFFEVKTGYRDSFTFSTGKKIRGRFGVDSTPLSHAILQLLIPIETMKRHYGIRAIDGYVLHVNEATGVRVYRVPTNAQLPRDKLYNYVIRMNQKAEKEKEEKRTRNAAKAGVSGGSRASRKRPREPTRSTPRLASARRSSAYGNRAVKRRRNKTSTSLVLNGARRGKSSQKSANNRSKRARNGLSKRGKKRKE